MKRIVAIPANLTVTYDLSNFEVLYVPTLDTDDSFTKIAKCGLAIEEFLLQDGKIVLYQDSLQFPLAGIIYRNSAIGGFINTSEPWVQTIRGDEIVFPTLHRDYNGSWIFGNVRSLVKLAAIAPHLNIPDLVRLSRQGDNSEQSKLVWLAARIGLKVYGQTEMKYEDCYNS